MLGHDHALSGALAFTAVAPLLHVTGVHLAAGMALTAGAGVLPDLDEPGSTIARTFGFLTGAFAWIVHKISGGHRKGTHSLAGVAVMAVASLAAGSWQAGARAVRAPELWWHLVPAGLILALLFSAGPGPAHRRPSRRRGRDRPGRPDDLEGLGFDHAAERAHPGRVRRPGMLAHIAGDMCTHDGCPLLYPLSGHEFGLLPEPLRITTNKLAERWLVSPLLLAGLAYLIWRDSGFSLALPSHLAGRLSRRHHRSSGRSERALSPRSSMPMGSSKPASDWPACTGGQPAPDDAAPLVSGRTSSVLGIWLDNFLVVAMPGRPARRGGYPGFTGGLWLCRILVLPGFHAVVVPSGFRTRVQPHLWITTWWWKKHSSTQSLVLVLPPFFLCLTWWTSQAWRAGCSLRPSGSAGRAG